MEVTTERISKIMVLQTTGGEIRSTMTSKVNATVVNVEVGFHNQTTIIPRTVETETTMTTEDTVLVVIIVVEIVTEMVEEEVFLPMEAEARMIPSVLLVVLVPTAKWFVTINYFTIR